MTIRSTMQVEKPDAVEVTLAVTMSLGEWKSVVEDLARPNTPGRNLRAVIRDGRTIASYDDRIRVQCVEKVVIDRATGKILELWMPPEDSR